jgi:hypothetical protein
MRGRSSLTLNEKDLTSLHKGIAIMLIAIAVIARFALKLRLFEGSQLPAIFELDLP